MPIATLREYLPFVRRVIVCRNRALAFSAASRSQDQLRSCFNLTCPFGGSGCEYLRRKAGEAFISSANVLCELADRLTCDKTNRAASKAASGHACPENARLCFCQINHEVEFGTANLIVIPQAVVGICHEPAEGGEVATFQGIRGFCHAGVFGDYVPAPFINDFGNSAGVPFQISEDDITQAAHVRQRTGK